MISVSGKFVHGDGERLFIQGVGYGARAPEDAGVLFPAFDRVAGDFEEIAALGANTVRTYASPPLSLLDEAGRCGLRVIAGVPWPTHLRFLDSRSAAREMRSAIRRAVARLASHPATLCVAIGNEIPTRAVRWYGRPAIEAFLRELVDDAKDAAPDALLTCVNTPQTEYLDTSCFDICAFGLFLEREADLRAYLARLQHVAGSRPLLLVDAGDARLPDDPDQRAALVSMQLEVAAAEGACGAVAFNWTDRAWLEDEDHAEERVAVQRRPFTAHPPACRLAPGRRVTVVVCAYNAADTIGECLDAIARLRYPEVEVVVVNDGSTDGTAAIAASHAGVRLINTPNRGLSIARNVGLAHASGDIVAYTDADVRVDPDWLTYLVQPFAEPGVVAVGGPNIVPPDDPWIAQCVAQSPGAPTHVLLDDRLAEHIPGCNCAFRRDALAAIGGFDPRFLRAGDDVDVCWRLQARGWRIGFAPAALVWHHHRATVRAYLRQQIGYGEGETWLMDQHPEKFSSGHIAWRGHIYSPLPFVKSISRTRINGAPFGTAAFPAIYRTQAHPLTYLPHSGRWQVATVLLAVLTALAAYTRQPNAALPAAAAMLAAGATLVKCLLHGVRSDVTRLPRIGVLSYRSSRLAYRLTIAVLHVLQPYARLYGRCRGFFARPAATSDDRAQPLVGEPRPALALDALRLLGGRSAQRLFWSDQPIDLSAFLSDVVDRVQNHCATRHIALDAGWWEDRDLTMDRGWVRLDLTALVEARGSDADLCLRIRSRIGSAGVVLMVALGAAMLVAGAGVMTWMLGALAGAAVLAGDALTALSVLSGALDGAAVEFGMSPKESTLRAPRVLPARWQRLHSAPGSRRATVVTENS